MGTTVTALDSSYTTLISSILEVERQPLVTITAKRDQASLQKSIYSDLKNMLTDLQSSVKALNSQDVFYSLVTGRTAKVSGAPTGSTVFTASADSTAALGSFQVGVTTLAKEHRVRSDRQDYVDQALGLSGQFLIGGQASRSVTATTNSTVTGIATSAVLEGQQELGNDDYSVEARYLDGTGWQFRLVNANGEAMSIRSSDDSYTTGWQSVQAGAAHDTGRGLTLTFGADTGAYEALNRLHSAPMGAYTAQGVAIDIGSTDTLANIASKINAASYAEGNIVSASIVDNQLFLTNGRQGAGRLIQTADVSGGVLASLGLLSGASYKNLVQNPGNATLNVNGLEVTRTKNTGLSDVISRVNLSLAGDAEGKSATLDVGADYANETAAATSFAQKFTKLMEYLSAKIAVTKNADGSYTRGALANDSIFSSLRLDLVRQVSSSYETSGSLENLTEMGFSLSDSFQFKLSSTTKFEEALKSNRGGVTALLDTVMTTIDTTLSRFTGATGYVSSVSTSLDEQVKSMNGQIATWNTRLTARQEQLIEQYAAVQTQISQMSALSAQLSAFWSA